MPVIEFATIVSLLAQFREGRKANAAESELTEFLEWLLDSNHAELKELIDQNAQTTVYIKALLNRDHQLFKQQLEQIDKALAVFAQRFDGFSELALLVNPTAKLSTQSMNILRQFEKTGARIAVDVSSSDGLGLLFDKGGNLQVEDPRFLEDDLATMVDLGLLRQDYTSRGTKRYIFTRQAAELLERDA